VPTLPARRMSTFATNDDSMGLFLLVLSVAIIFVLFWWTYYECTGCTWRSPQEMRVPRFQPDPRVLPVT